MSSSMTSIALFLMSLKKRLFACFSSEMLCLSELRNALKEDKQKRSKATIGIGDFSGCFLGFPFGILGGFLGFLFSHLGVPFGSYLLVKCFFVRRRHECALCHLKCIVLSWWFVNSTF